MLPSVEEFNEASVLVEFNGEEKRLSESDVYGLPVGSVARVMGEMFVRRPDGWIELWYGSSLTSTRVFLKLKMVEGTSGAVAVTAPR